MIDSLSRILPTLLPMMVPVLCIILIAVFYAIIFKKKVSETFFLSIVTIVMILFFSGLMNFQGCLLVGYIIIIVLSFGSLVFLIKSLIKNKNLLRDISLFSSLLIFTLFLCIALFLNYKRMFINWDEFSHWGVVVKSMFQFDAMATYTDSTIMFKSYLPGTALFQYFLVRPYTQFTEFPTYIASNLIFFSIISVFIKKIDFKTILLVVSALLIPLLTGGNFYCTLYVDSLLGILFGSTLLFYYYYKYEKSLFGIVMVVATICLLTLVKDMGFIFAGIAIFVVIVDCLIFKRKDLNKYILTASHLHSKIIRFLILISPIIGSISVELLWKFHLKLNHITSIWNTSNISIQDFVKGTLLPYQNETVKLFIDAVINKPLIFELSFLKIFLILLSISLILGISLKKRAVNFKRLITTFVTILIGSLLYIGILFLFYVFLMSHYEAVILAGYERYVLTYIIGIFFFLLIFIVLEPKSNSSILTKNRLLNDTHILISTLTIFLIYAFLINGTVKYIESDILNARKTANETLTLREPYNGIKLWTRYPSFNSDRVYILSQGDIGLDKLKLIYTLYPTSIKWIYDYSVALEPYYPEQNDPWTKIITSTDWEEYVINNYDLVYIFKYDQKFVDSYGHFFDKVTADTLYKVTLNDQGELKLISLTK